MPFIEEDKFKSILEDLAEKEAKLEEAENELTEAQEDLASYKKKSIILPIVLGVLLGAALGAAYFFYSTSSGSVFPSSEEVAEIKTSEKVRVLDSISRANARAARNAKKSKSGISKENLDSTINEVQSSGDTVYSVQIGVLSQNKFPLLSSQTIPSTVTSSDGFFKYSLGLYTTVQEAKDLRNELIKLGFKDAFVASYIDGKRQQIHD